MYPKLDPKFHVAVQTPQGTLSNSKEFNPTPDSIPGRLMQIENGLGYEINMAAQLRDRLFGAIPVASNMSPVGQSAYDPSVSDQIGTIQSRVTELSLILEDVLKNF